MGHVDTQSVTVERPHSLVPTAPARMAPLVIDGANFLITNSFNRTGDDTDYDYATPLADLYRFLVDAGSPSVKIVAPSNQLFNSDGRIWPSLQQLYLENCIIEIPNGKFISAFRQITPRDVACAEVAHHYNVNYSRLRSTPIHHDTFNRILRLLSNPTARLSSLEHRRRLPLDDIVAVYEAQRQEGCVVSGDHFRDLELFDHSVVPFLSRYRLHIRYDHKRRLVLKFPFSFTHLFETPLYMCPPRLQEATEK